MLPGQTVNLGDNVARPIPGAGHDYIKGLEETVNPANGQVFIKIDLPVPADRGLTIPFAITYNSGEVFPFSSYMAGCGALWNPPCSSTAVNPRSVNGWSDTFPYVTVSDTTVPLPPYAPTSGGSGTPTSYCVTSSSYNFYDPSGGTHQLGLAGISSVQGSMNYETPSACASVTYNTTDCIIENQENGFYGCQGGDPYQAVSSGGDDQVSAKSDLCTGYYVTGGSSNPPADCTGGQPTFTVTDTSGTVYSFPQDGELLFPTQIEDRNGNILQVSGSDDPGQGLSITDTLGRPVISIAEAAGNPPYPTKYTVGGLTYTLTYATTSADFNSTGNQIDVPPSNSSDPTSCGATFDVQKTGMQVLQSITLPNGQSYQFQYWDGTWGLIKEIDYPDGGWVRYTWKLSDQPSTLATFNASQNNGAFPPLVGYCNYQYYTPVVATRTVGYSQGSSAAETQTFGPYDTQWGTPPSQWSPPTSSAPFYDRAWTSKTTTVVTADNITNQSFTTKYTYSSVFQPLQPDSQGQMPAQLSVEQTVAHQDWNGNTLETVSKAWADQFEMTSESTLLNNGQTSTTTYQYNSGYPEAVTLKTETGSGASAPYRQTSYSYYRLAEPNQVIVKNGSGTRVAETDVYYDGQSALGPASTAVPVASGVSDLPSGTHDETNYGPSSTLPRGNPTKVVRWLNTGASPTTSYTFDETGQELSKTDPCGNTSCSDMTGSGHTTQYSYTDKYTVLSSGQNIAYTPDATTNAFVTTITDPLAQTEHFSYDYNNSQLTSAEDENSQTTTYVYNDSLNRLTEVQRPADPANGGQHPTTNYAYNDSENSPSVTTSKLLNTSGASETSVAVRDGLDHVVQTQLTSDPDGTDYVNMSYDGMGWLYSKTNAFRGSPGSPPSGTTTYYSYDALGRPTIQTQQDSSYLIWCYNGTPSLGQTSSECLGNQSAQTPFSWVDSLDETGRHWQQGSDALGRLIDAMEPNSSDVPTTETDYAYDTVDDLLSVTQWGGTSGSPASNGPVNRTFTYDSLSRLVCGSNPESATAACPATPSSYTAGTTGYTYDSDDNLSARTDARGIITTYSYDDLSRVISKTYSDAVTPWTCYEYGTTATATSGANQIDRMIYEWTQSTGTACGTSPPSSGYKTLDSLLSYNPVGQLKTEQECTPANCGGTPYQLQYSYDLGGDETGSTNGISSPAIALSMNYDGAARLLQVSSSMDSDANHPADLFQSPSYDATGHLTAVDLGYNPQTSTSTVTMSRSYDNRLRITSETDNASEVVNSAGVAGSGSVSVTGTEQMAAYSSGSVSFSGTEQSMVSDGETVYDQGNILVLVDGMDYQVPYGQNSTPSSLAAYLASIMVCSPSSGFEVQGDAVGSTVYFASCSSGPNTSYSLSAADDGHSSSFANYSFTVSASGSSMTPVTSLPSSGNAIAFTGTESSGQSSAYTILVFPTGSNDPTKVFTLNASSSSTPSTLAATLVSGLGSCSTSGVVVTGVQSGGTVVLQPCQSGTSYYFEGNLDACSPSGGSGSCIAMSITDPELPGVTSGPTYDTGTVSLTVNGTQIASATYGSSSTQTSIASALAASNSSTSPVTVTASGSGLIMTAKAVGAATDYSYSLGFSSSYPTLFSPPSFGSPAPSGSLTGGANVGEQPEVAYSYSIPSNNGYAPNGNIETVTDSVTGTWTYGYDNLNRVTSAIGDSGSYQGAGVAAVTLGWTYDPFGNLEGQTSSSGNFPTFWAHYTGPNNRATATYYATGGVTYDNSGDIEADGRNDYAYDAEGRVCAVWDGSDYTGYVYDADGNRVAKGTVNGLNCNPASNSFSLTFSYVLGQSGEDITQLNGSAQWQFSNAYAGGRLLATYSTQNNDTYFALNDWLGTKRAEVTPDGCLETYASLPFGDDLTPDGNCPDATPLHYTGKERDSESGNDYFGARYYASSMGRFMSPDWSAKVEPVPYAKLDDPQSLNLYVYAHNNPLRNVDVDGHCDSSSKATANTKCQDVSNLHVNDAMKQKIKQAEGLPGTKGDPALKVYKDGAGNLTVGWGHKVTAADNLKEGDTIKTDQAQKFFDSDLSSKETAVANVLTSNGGHQFSQGEFNALVDLTYNAGPGALTTSMSPSLMKDMNAGDYTGMSGQLRYTKDSAGNVEPGLVTRSDDRQAIFLGADPDSQ